MLRIRMKIHLKWQECIADEPDSYLNINTGWLAPGRVGCEAWHGTGCLPNYVLVIGFATVWHAAQDIVT
jgi:hypothetical protein